MPKHCQAEAPQERLKQSKVTASLEEKERKENKKTEVFAGLFLAPLCVFASVCVSAVFFF